MFGVGKHKSLGLAVTEQGITAVLIGGPKRGPGRAVLHTAELGFTKEIGLGDPEKLGRELRKVLRRNGMLAGSRGRVARLSSGRVPCVIGLAASWIATREKSLPAADDESLRAALAIAAEREFASGPADLALDYAAARETDSFPASRRPGAAGLATSPDSAAPPPLPRVSALFVAAPRRVVEQLATMAKVAGLSVAGITCSSAALAMATDGRSGKDAQTPRRGDARTDTADSVPGQPSRGSRPDVPAPSSLRLVLCLLPRGVELTVQGPPTELKSDWGPSAMGGLRLIRHLPVCFNHTPGSADVAESVLTPPSDEGRREGAPVVDSSLPADQWLTLSAELRRILANSPAGGGPGGLVGQRQPDSGQPDRQVLIWDSIGGGSGGPLAESIDSSIGSELGLPTRLCDPQDDLELTWGPESADPADRGRFAQAAALACLAGPGEGALAIDFLHSRLTPPSKSRIGRRVVLAAAAAVLLIGAGVWGVLDLQATQQEIDRLQTQVDDARDGAKQAKALVDDVTFAQSWFDRRPHVERCLAEISPAFGPFPRDGRRSVWGTTLTITVKSAPDEMQATLTGTAVDEATALAVLARLQANPHLANVKPKELIPAGGTSTDVKFAISLSMAPDAPKKE